VANPGLGAIGRGADAAHLTTMDLNRHIECVVSWLDAVYPESADRRVDEMQILNTRKNAGASLEMATDGELARASIHEASHAVMAHHFGLRIRGALIRADASGAVEFETELVSAEDLLGPAVTCLAPPFAELIRGADRVREFHLAHGPDILMAKRHADRSRVRDPQLSNEVFAKLSCAAVVSNWKTIERVASALRCCGELDAETISALCERQLQ
jgi:hypothetical protein